MAELTETKLPETLQRTRLLSFQEARQFLGVGNGTLYKLLHSKNDPVPSIKLGKLHKFQLDKLLWWIEKHES